jgi:hypothetical protein
MNKLTLLPMLFAAIVVGAGCPPSSSSSSSTSSSSTTTQRSAETAPHPQLLNDLALFATGKSLSPDELDKRSAKLASGDLTLESYVDELLKKPMGPQLARELVISPSGSIKDRHPIPSHSILRSAEVGSDTLYWLRDKCDPSTAVRVKPWWSDSEVLVCPEAYRPEVKGDAAGRTCGASMLAPRESDVCGCGPRLIFCTKDADQFKKMKDEISDEIGQTAAYVVDHDMPVESLFTMNETVRSAPAEALYRRARVAAGEPDTLFPVTDFPEKKGELRPRHEQVPGQHAGVLTASALIYSSDALRGVMRNYYDYLWCAGVASSRVTTDAILGLDVVDLRTGDGWKQLAGMNVCTDCHARLDYGMQFFWGYPSSTMGIDFRPKDVRKGKGPLYANDIKDDRGEAELTPQGFAKLAVAQPEFGKCMTKKVVEQVFNGTQTADDFTAVHTTFESTHRIKAMMKTAMLLYAERNKDGPPARAAAASATDVVASEGDTVPVPKQLRELLDDRCMNCHDKGDAYDFNGDTLPRSTMVAMMDQVGFKAMPANAQGLDEGARQEFLRAVAPLAFPVEADRNLALEYFGSGLRGKPVHRYQSALTNVHARTGAQGNTFRPNAIEGDIEQKLMVYSPGVALTSAVTALRDCKAAKLEGAALEACVDRSSAPGTVIVGAVAAGGDAADGEKSKRKKRGKGN